MRGSYKLGFPGGSDGKESTCNAGDLGSIPRLGRSPGEGQSNLLQYSCLENPHGQRSQVAYSPWSCKESDTTERLSTQHTDIKYTWSETKPISSSGMIVVWRTMKNIIDNPQSLSNYSSLLNVQILQGFIMLLHVSFKCVTLKSGTVIFLSVKNYCLDVPGGSVVKKLPANAGDTGLISDPGRSHMLPCNQGHAPQLGNLCSRAGDLQLRSPHTETAEAHLPQRIHCSEKPVRHNSRAAPAHCSQRKTPGSSKDTAQ